MDFADYLRNAREKAGLNQSELAERVGLTGSYISVLESRRKPPPSDRVLRGLARALDRPEQEILEVAHLDRAPEDIRKKIRELHRRLGLEQKLASKLLTDILPSSLWHFWRVRGFHEYGVEKVRLDSRKKRVLKKVLRRIGHLTTRDDFEEESRRVIEALSAEERDALAEVLPELVPAEGPPPAASAEPPTLDRPPARRGKDPYFLPSRDSDMLPRIEKADLLLVDPGRKPGAGDLVVVRQGKKYTVRHLVDAPGGRLLAASDPTVPPVPCGPGDLLGVVVEIRRRLA